MPDLVRNASEAARNNRAASDSKEVSPPITVSAVGTIDWRSMMKFKRVILAIAFSTASLGIYAQAPDARDPKADNTKVNKRDRAAGEPTADQQKNNRSDLDLTKDIRRSIMDDKALSTYAHNVK